MICSYIFFSQNNEFIQIAFKSGSAAAAFHQMWFSKTVVKQRFKGAETCSSAVVALGNTWT